MIVVIRVSSQLWERIFRDFIVHFSFQRSGETDQRDTFVHIVDRSRWLEVFGSTELVKRN